MQKIYADISDEKNVRESKRRERAFKGLSVTHGIISLLSLMLIITKGVQKMCAGAQQMVRIAVMVR